MSIRESSLDREVAGYFENNKTEKSAEGSKPDNKIVPDSRKTKEQKVKQKRQTKEQKLKQKRQTKERNGRTKKQRSQTKEEQSQTKEQQSQIKEQSQSVETPVGSEKVSPVKKRKFDYESEEEEEFRGFESPTREEIEAYERAYNFYRNLERLRNNESPTNGNKE